MLNPPLDFSWDIINPNSGWNIVGQYDSIPNFEFEENIGPDSILYILELTTQTDNGCTDISLDTLTIYPTPIIDFSPTGTQLTVDLGQLHLITCLMLKTMKTQLV